MGPLRSSTVDQHDYDLCASDYTCINDILHVILVVYCICIYIFKMLKLQFYYIQVALRT